MRTDYKIGIAVVLFVTVLVVVYFVLTGPSEKAAPVGEVDRVASGGADEGARNVVEPPPTVAERPPAAAPPADGTAPPEPAEGTSPFRTVALKSTSPEKDLLPGAGESMSPPEIKPPAALSPSVLKSGPPGAEYASLKPLTAEETDPTPLRPGTSLTGTPLTGTSLRPGPFPAETGTQPRVYVVQEGDQGFWDVAKAAYGDGRKWTLIRDANPDADTNHLRRGQKLVIPPLPKETAPAVTGSGTGPGAAPGGLVPGVAGEKIYIVEKGDAGFWGIAEKVYGRGKHWPLIANANRDVDSTSLQPGQKLRIPPLPEPAAAKPSGAGLSTGTVGAAGADAPGTYRVQQGDQGFWGVAAKVYRDGSLWPAIQKANPDVSSSELRVGQVLKIPPLEEAKGAVSAPSAAARPSTGKPVVYDGRPIFD